MALSVIQQQTINLANYQETVTGNEVHIVGDSPTHHIDQTIIINPPCILFYDPVNGNLVTIPLGSDYDPNFKMVKFVSGIQTVLIPSGD